MSNQYYNVYEFDQEMMNFADELLRQYPNINDYLRAMGVQPTVNLPKDAPVLP
jgi:hypothetical protein